MNAKNKLEFRSLVVSKNFLFNLIEIKKILKVPPSNSHLGPLIIKLFICHLLIIKSV